MIRKLFTLILIFISIAAFCEDAGKILTIRHEGTMSPLEIDSLNEELFKGYNAPKAQYSVDVYWIEFESLYPDGETAVITSQVFIPDYNDKKKRSVYVFGSGSTGLRDSCRPSREHIMGIRWGLYRSHVLAHAGQGSIGVMPDYMGFGDPERLQYYMVAQCEARVMLDSIRATKNLIEALEITTVNGTSHFVSGFSQGGHAAFAAADYQKSYAPEIPLSGIIGYGPTTDVFSLFREYSDIAPMALYTYEQLYGSENIDVSKVLLDKYTENLERDLIRMCVGGMQSYYPQVPDGLFKEPFIKSLLEETLETDYPLLYQHINKNSTGLGNHKVPTVIYQGGNDIVIYRETQEAFVEKLRSNGVPVDYIFYKNARHDTRQISFQQSRDWINRHTN